ncbi:MAG: hypothetical protein, partial [Olavius algarvensis Gamma 1 endosymbiont]
YGGRERPHHKSLSRTIKYAWNRTHPWGLSSNIECLA